LKISDLLPEGGILLIRTFELRRQLYDKILVVALDVEFLRVEEPSDIVLGKNELV
jgi:hypothetical protein